MRFLRLGAIPGLIAFLAVALGYHGLRQVNAAPATQTRARVAVAVFPDLYGQNKQQSECPGCDQQFTSEDTAANAVDPLAAMEVALVDADGKELDRNTTSGLANGRQVTFFSVDEPGSYTVKILDLKPKWSACPGGSLERKLKAGDFDETTGFASVDFYVWRGCGGSAASGHAAVATEGMTTTEGVTVTEGVTATGGMTATEGMTATTGMTATEAVTTTAALSTTESLTPTTPAAAASPVAVVTVTMTSGAIRGVVFEDANQDGKLDAGEMGVPNAVLRLVGLGESGETKSAGAGTYAFGALNVGSYDVYLDVPAGYRATTPDQYVGLPVEAATVMGIDFGLVPSTAELAADQAGAPVAVTQTVTVTSTDVPYTPVLPSTGVQVDPLGRGAVGLALAIGVLGALGLALEARLGRRSTHTAEGGEDA